MKPRIVGIGEVLWDVLPDGRKLGGAPANFAYHAGALGADVCLISRVGKDALGREALQKLALLGLPAGSIQIDPELPTGTVTVELNEGGQPRFTIHENVAWDALTVEPSGKEAVEQADAICFGTLAQRSERTREAIQALVACAGPGAWRVLDINLRAPFFSREVIEHSLQKANLLKLNETELPHLAAMFQLRGDARMQLIELAERFVLRCIALTEGSRGSWLYLEGEWSFQPAFVTTVVDTVGAGDAFTAGVVFGLLAGWPLAAINRRAAELAAFVCSQAGATPQLPHNIRALFSGNLATTERKKIELRESNLHQV